MPLGPLTSSIRPQKCSWSVRRNPAAHMPLLRNRAEESEPRQQPRPTLNRPCHQLLPRLQPRARTKPLRRRSWQRVLAHGESGLFRPLPHLPRHWVFSWRLSTFRDELSLPVSGAGPASDPHRPSHHENSESMIAQSIAPSGMYKLTIPPRFNSARRRRTSVRAKLMSFPHSRRVLLSPPFRGPPTHYSLVTSPPDVPPSG